MLLVNCWYSSWEILNLPRFPFLWLFEWIMKNYVPAVHLFSERHLEESLLIIEQPLCCWSLPFVSTNYWCKAEGFLSLGLILTDFSFNETTHFDSTKQTDFFEYICVQSKFIYLLPFDTETRDTLSIHLYKLQTFVFPLLRW